MKLEIENCKCGGHGCTGKLLYLDGSLMDGIHDAETATTLQTAVNLHDELVEALRSTLPDKRAEAVLAKVERKGK
jgi:hypothetical protein